jgi:putative toxin-antitoxin system antitoxin component (TIGR02293 family)
MARHSLAGVEGALGSATVARVLGVHPRTLARRTAAKQSLRPLDAQRQEKLVRIWRELHEIFTDENARRWLELPNPVLDERPPLEVMSDDGGLDRVLQVIGRMAWGIPA